MRKNILRKEQHSFCTAVRFAVWLCFIATGVMVSRAEEPADGFSTVFSVPPFQIGEFALEANGWTAVGPLATAEDEYQRSKWAPVIAEIPMNGSKTALVVPSHGIIKYFQDNLQGRVRVTSVMQVGPNASSELTISLLFGKRAIIDFGCESRKNSKQEGFFYRLFGVPSLNIEGTEPKTIVPLEDIVPWESYTFVVEVDIDAQTLDIRIMGKKPDGSPLDIVVKDIQLPFLTDTRIEHNVSGIRLVGSGSMDVPGIFLESLEVRNAP